jgi:hypothetical protein
MCNCTTVPKRQKNVACKEQDGEIVRQDKITRIVFVLQWFYFIVAHRVLSCTGSIFFYNLNILHAKKKHVLYLTQKVPYIWPKDEQLFHINEVLSYEFSAILNYPRSPKIKYLPGPSVVQTLTFISRILTEAKKIIKLLTNLTRIPTRWMAVCKM